MSDPFANYQDVRRLYDKINSLQDQINTLQQDNIASSTSIAAAPTTIPNSVQAHMNNGQIHYLQSNIDFIKFNTGISVTPERGMIYWNDDDETVNIQTETETVIQVGQEQVIRAKNDTGVTLNNGELVYISDASAGRPELTLANADAWETSQNTIGIITSDIVDGAVGYATTLGLVRDLNTTGFTAGDVIYLDVNDGQFVSTPPAHPAFVIRIGYIIVVDASDGVIFFEIDHDRNPHFYNGTFIESFDADITSDGATITLSIERTGTGNLTMRFSDGHSTLVTAPATIALTAGSDTVPQANYIYVLQSTKVLTKSTTGWPTGVEHIKVSKSFVQSAGEVQTNGALINQNWNDHGAGTDAQGHLAHLGENIRLGPAKYFSGIAGVGVDDYLTVTNNNAHFKSSSGIISQLHKQTFPAFDQSTGGIVHIVNDSVTPYKASSNLDTDITADSTGAAIGNNKYFNVTFWGVANKSGEYAPVMCNLPGGFYNGSSDAINDVSGYNNDSMPRAFDLDSSTGFLICRVTIQMKTAASWVVVNTKDLRKPTGVSGGTVGAITEFPDSIFDIHNVTDVTKKIVFDASGITTATTRTITMDDANVDLGAINDFLDQAVKSSSTPTFAGAHFTADFDLPFSGGTIRFNTDDLILDSDGSNGYVKSGSSVYIQTNTSTNALQLDASQNAIFFADLRPNTAEASDIGSVTKEFGDIFLGDDKKVQFGLDQDASIEWVSASSWLLLSGLTKFANDITGNFLMDGTTTDDERLRLPYLTGVPASVDNGSIWMEADGLHIYYNGAEKLVAGV